MQSRTHWERRQDDGKNADKAFDGGAAASAGPKAPYMAAHRGAAVLLCVHAGRICGRFFRGKADLSAHRCGRGAHSGQLHAFSAGAVRLHFAVRPVFLRIRLRLRQLGRCRLGAVRACPEKAVPPQKAVPSAGAGGALGAEGQISAAGGAGGAVCDPAGKAADRRKPVGGVFPPDGSASAAGGLWCGHRASCAHFAGYGGAAPVLLSVPLPHGSGVCPAAGAAICAAAPAERRLHPGLQCL